MINPHRIIARAFLIMSKQWDRAPGDTLKRNPACQRKARIQRILVGCVNIEMVGRNHAGRAKRQRFACPGARLDRKSTRLNSSHQKISYAVFCLKKKKE